jgi:hypothetical protein
MLLETSIHDIRNFPFHHERERRYGHREQGRFLRVPTLWVIERKISCT